ncbi:MAG: toxin-antitoxin system YwqK family antitoxin [Cytophagaceae bacterium]
MSLKRKFLYFFIATFFMVAHDTYSQVHKKVQTWYDLKKLYPKEEYYVLVKSPQVLDSIFISYFQNGRIKAKGLFLKNKPMGLWEYFYENGNPKMKGEVQDKNNTGVWTYYYENGNLQMKGSFEKGQRDGDWDFYYENGSLKNTGRYKKDMRVGIWNYYSEDGSFKAQATYDNDKGTYREFFPGGAIKSQGAIVDGKSNGLWKYFYEDGTLKAEGIEKDGLKEGMWKFYHPNGNLYSEGAYSKGVQQGQWKYYHENGVLSAEGEQYDGDKQGYWKLYYNSGAFKGEGNFDRGEGDYKEYYESGKLKIEGHIKKDKNDGQWNYYYETGELEGSCHFTMGKGFYTGYYESGNLKMEGMLLNGEKVDVWKLYKEDGSLSGYYKTYYENDVPVLKPLQAAPDSAKSDSLGLYEKPKLKIPKKKSRYYSKKINEYKGFIVSGNPLALIRYQFPLNVEYYIQERIGVEFNYTLLRDPFFRGSGNMPVNSIYRRGFYTSLRHKLYQPDRDYGMFYFGHEIRFTSIDYGQRIMDTTGVVTFINKQGKSYQLY